MTGPKRPDPNDIAANEAVAASATTTILSAATTLNATPSSVSSVECKETGMMMASAMTSFKLGSSENSSQQESNSQRYQQCQDARQHQDNHHPLRPYPLHPHQLAHQHTYPKISLTSIPATSCIKEEDEYGEEGVLLEKRRLSAHYMDNNKGELTAYNQSVGFRRTDGSEDEENSNLAMVFSHPTHGTPMGATIPRTFSTSALRIKNRCTFWDRLHTPR